MRMGRMDAPVRRCVADAEPSPWGKVKRIIGMFRIGEFARLGRVGPDAAKLGRRWACSGRPGSTRSSVRLPPGPAAGAAPDPRAARRRRPARGDRASSWPAARTCAASSSGGEPSSSGSARGRAAARRPRISVAMAEGRAAPDVVVRPVADERVAAVRCPVATDACGFYDLEAYVRDVLGRRRARAPARRDATTGRDLRAGHRSAARPAARSTIRRLPAARVAVGHPPRPVPGWPPRRPSQRWVSRPA